MRALTLMTFLILITAQAATAQERLLVKRVSADHTEIVIHDQSAAAYEARRAQAEGALERLKQKRAARLEEAQRRQREGELRDQLLARAQAQTQPVYPTPRYNQRKRPSFFNGGHNPGGSQSPVRYRPGRASSGNIHRPGPIFRSGTIFRNHY